MRATLHIQNLKCGNCEVNIVSNLSEVRNISEVEVNQDDETVSFDYHTNHDFENAKNRLAMIGYPIVGADNTL